jgi:hypothetical protein
MRRGLTFGTAAAAILALSPAREARATEIQVEYEAQVLAVTSMHGAPPFGLTAAHIGQPVTGSFTYDTAVADSDSSAINGVFPHAGGGGAFTAVLPGGVVVTGSGKPRVETVNGMSSDSFRFKDGTELALAPMSVNGVPNAALGLELRISDWNATAMSSDALPEVFPFQYTGPAGGPYPWSTYDFPLWDAAGGILLGLTRVQQVPEPAAAAVLALPAAVVSRRQRRPRARA